VLWVLGPVVLSQVRHTLFAVHELVTAYLSQQTLVLVSKVAATQVLNAAHLAPQATWETAVYEHRWFPA